MEEKVKISMTVIVLMLLFTSNAFAADRYDTFLFGVDYYPEHWPEEYWEQDA